MSHEIDERLGALIERLQSDLHESLPPGTLEKIVLYCAASELVCEDLQPKDRDYLRFAALHLALVALGVTDAAIERAKEVLKGREPDTLNRRH